MARASLGRRMQLPLLGLGSNGGIRQMSFVCIALGTVYAIVALLIVVMFRREHHFLVRHPEGRGDPCALVGALILWLFMLVAVALVSLGALAGIASP